MKRDEKSLWFTEVVECATVAVAMQIAMPGGARGVDRFLATLEPTGQPRTAGRDRQGDGLKSSLEMGCLRARFRREAGKAAVAGTQRSVEAEHEMLTGVATGSTPWVVRGPPCTKRRDAKDNLRGGMALAAICHLKMCGEEQEVERVGWSQWVVSGLRNSGGKVSAARRELRWCGCG